MISSLAQAQDTFMVQDGAFPWHDRATGPGAWSLARVPAGLKGNGPLAQQNCASRALDVPAGQKTVTFGVSEGDLPALKAKFPTAAETGETIAVRNAAGTELPYRVLTLAQPPAKLSGGFGAGLLLLGQGTPSAPASPPQPFVPTAPVAGQNMYVVRDGAFPWYDRAEAPNSWALDNVPPGLRGNGPLPQQSCSSRSLQTPAGVRSLVVGVADKDAAKFKALYPAATDTGQALAVKNPAGITIPYRAFAFPDPPAKIAEGAGLSGGLLLLKAGDGAAGAAVPAVASPAPATPTRPATSIAPAAAPAVPNIAAASATPAAAVPAAGVVLPPKANFHIYLLMGQSNMVGRDTTTLGAQGDDPRVLALDGKGQWVIAREPMHVGGTGVGPGIPFAQEMLRANPRITIGLVPCAVGGTALSRWVKGADLYEKAVARAKAAAGSGTVVGMLWHQGESDTGKQEDADSYEARLTGMIKDLRTDLGLPALPIVVGQLGDFLTPARYPFVDTVRGAIEHIPVVVPAVAYVDATGLQDKGDKLHFSAEAQKEFGTRYARAMQDLLKPKPAPQTPLPRPQAKVKK